MTFVAKVGDQTRVIEGIDPPFGYAVEITEDEQEYLLSQYLDPKTSTGRLASMQMRFAIGIPYMRYNRTKPAASLAG